MPVTSLVSTKRSLVLLALLNVLIPINEALTEDDGGTDRPISTRVIIGIALFVLCVIIAGIIIMCFWCRGCKCQRACCSNCCHWLVVCCRCRPQQPPSDGDETWTGQPVVTSDLDASPVVYMSRSPDNTFIPVERTDTTSVPAYASAPARAPDRLPPSTTRQPGSGTSVTAPMLGRSIAPPPYPSRGQPLEGPVRGRQPVRQGNTSSTEPPPPYSTVRR